MNIQEFILQEFGEFISSDDLDNQSEPTTPIEVENTTPQVEEGGRVEPQHTPKSREKSPKIEQNREEEERFDLAKAVVYSEILRPKFKDYEF